MCLSRSSRPVCYNIHARITGQLGPGRMYTCYSSVGLLSPVVRFLQKLIQSASCLMHSNNYPKINVVRIFFNSAKNRLRVLIRNISMSDSI